jgi:two-component system chemotaxis response regulator CheB
MDGPSPLLNADAVVVGASAGGVDALIALVGSLRADFAPPVLIVLHLPRDRPSTLAALLGGHCALPVREAEDKMPLAPGVLVAPPDYHLLVEPDGCVALSVDEPVLYSRPAIDVLFESAAAVFSDRLLAILLTGASSDGSAGMAAVRRAGGIGWIQDPGDATVPTLPAAALAHAGADAVLTLKQMCGRLAAIAP